MDFIELEKALKIISKNCTEALHCKDCSFKKFCDEYFTEMPKDWDINKIYDVLDIGHS